MGELRKMEYLDVNHNEIYELPDFLGCTALKEIYIANNNIKVNNINITLVNYGKYVL